MLIPFLLPFGGLFNRFRHFSAFCFVLSVCGEGSVRWSGQPWQPLGSACAFTRDCCSVVIQIFLSDQVLRINVSEKDDAPGQNYPAFMQQ